MIEFRTSLLPHQVGAHEKFKRLKVGALFMEMGTGKTRTMLEIIKDKYDKGKIDKVIWFCPCSAKINIKQELEKHLITGHDIFVIAGIESMSTSIRLNSFLYNYVQEHRCLLVVDESSKIKNHFAKRSVNINRLGDFCDYKFILNGTPVTRDEGDLFNQFYFLDWRILGYKSYWSYARKHIRESVNGRKKSYSIVNVDYLTKRTSLYSYQAKKSDILELPGKRYKQAFFDITQQQRDNYSAFANEVFINYLDFESDLDVYVLFAGLQMITSGYKVHLDRERMKTTKEKLFDKVEENPRFLELMNCIRKFDDEKIIIFCKYTDEVTDITNALNKIYGLGSAIEYFGSISEKKRNANLEEFKTTARFLVANKGCASYSLNLQHCSKVIYYNNDFDFGSRAQSEDRIHRIGQTKDVTYIDIVASNTLEETIIKCLEKKESLSEYINRQIKLYGSKDSFMKALSSNKSVEKVKFVGDLLSKR